MQSADQHSRSGKLAQTIGVYQTAFFGDTVLSVGFVKNLKILFPNSKITFICRKNLSSLLKFVPEIDEIIEDHKIPSLSSIPYLGSQIHIVSAVLLAIILWLRLYSVRKTGKMIDELESVE